MGCVRRGEPTITITIPIEMKLQRISLGRNPLNDALCRNLGMVENEQGPTHHIFSGASYRDLDAVSSVQRSSRRILSGALRRHPGVVENEQGSSHLSRRMRG